MSLADESAVSRGEFPSRLEFVDQTGARCARLVSAVSAFCAGAKRCFGGGSYSVAIAVAFGDLCGTACLAMFCRAHVWCALLMLRIERWSVRRALGAPYHRLSRAAHSSELPALF